MVGMLSEKVSASRIRTGPRSFWSASRGNQSRANSVVTSASSVPGVTVSFIEAGRVDDRLPCRTGLPVSATGYVELRIELRRGQVIAVVAGAAHVGEDVAAARIDRDERPVVQVLAGQRLYPGAVLLEALFRDVAFALALRLVGDHRAGIDVALCQALSVHVERGDDLVAATVGRGAIGKELVELRLHVPDEVRCLEDDRRLVGEHDRLVQRLVELRRGQPDEVAVAFLE